MPRGPRLDAPGILHHVMARGIDGRELFLSDFDRLDFIDRLGRVCENGAAAVYAWCLMTNHFHLAIRTGNRSLAGTMRRLMTGYAVSFNRRHKRAGHLFQNRYKSTVVEDERYFLALVRYVHLNPVRAGMVKDVTGLSEYRWTGHMALLGKERHPWQDADEVLSRFGSRAGRARRELENFMKMSKGAEDEAVFGGGGLVRSMGGRDAVAKRAKDDKWAYDERILGSGGFVEAVLKRTQKPEIVRGLTKEEAWASFERLVSQVSKRMGLSKAELTGGSRRRSVVQGRRAIVQVAQSRLGLSATEIARVLNVSQPSIVKCAEHGLEALNSLGLKADEIKL